MMSDRRPAQNIGELDIHLSNLQQRVAEVAQGMQNMATKADIESIRSSMAALATKAEVAAEIHAIREEVERNKPSTLARQLVAFCAGLMVGAAVAGLFLQIAEWAKQQPAAAPASAVKP